MEQILTDILIDIASTYAVPILATFTVIQGIKAFVAVKFMPVVAMIIGIIFVVLFDMSFDISINGVTVLNGILVGAGASGLYSYLPESIKGKLNTFSK